MFLSNIVIFNSFFFILRRVTAFIRTQYLNCVSIALQWHWTDYKIIVCLCGVVSVCE